MHEVHYQCEVQLVGQNDANLNIEKLIEIDVPYDHDKQADVGAFGSEDG